jgi:hypothetical protein
METKSRNEKRKASKQWLRDRVLTILSSTESGKKLNQSSLEKIVDRVMRLFRDRVKAAGNQKTRVWAAGQRKILHDLRNPR